MDADVFFTSLPVPTVLIGSDETINDLNPEAEGFLNASAKSARGTPVWDIIAVGLGGLFGAAGILG